MSAFVFPHDRFDGAESGQAGNQCRRRQDGQPVPARELANAVPQGVRLGQHGVVASFSRALTEGLRVDQTPAEFDAALDASIASIYRASLT